MAEPTKKGSVLLAAEKARAHRVERLRASLDNRLDNAFAPVDALMAEMGDGDSQKDLWERLHAAAVRDGMQAALSDAYTKACVGPRMKRLSGDAQVEVLMHAADWFQGVMGDPAAAEGFLQRVLAIVPGQGEAFVRLEKHYDKLMDPARKLHLYASVAASPPRAVNVLANQSLNLLLSLKPNAVLSDEACRKLVALVPAKPKLLDALEAHARATKRSTLACELIEQALLDETMPEEQVVQRRHRLLELYAGDAAAPAAAIVHVESLLARDPSDAAALRAAERLLGSRDHASRAAAVLAAARRGRGG